MPVIYIGDFRCRSLQRNYDSGDNNDAENTYIINDFGNISWLSSDAQYQLEDLSPVSSSIVIMTGFQDCLNSCIWSTFKITDIVATYKTVLEKLVSNYVGHQFYFCSVNPVDTDYTTSMHDSGKVSKSTLNNKIKNFNNKMKEDCPVTFLDSYTYLTDCKYITRDGVRYTSETAKALQGFIQSQVNLNSLSFGSSFMSNPRIREEDAPHIEDESMKYWTHTDYGGLNKCISIAGTRYCIPNCVGYAWGRFYEITGEEPKLSRSNAENWWSYNDGYERGSTPRAGAVICWRHGAIGNDPNVDGEDAGHVAIVEQVNDDGSIIISESGYKNTAYNEDVHFTVRTISKGSGNWGGWTNYYFQGFIYPPQATTVTLASGNICTKNSYGITRAEMEPNVQYIWQYLGSKGWTKNAVAALVGNMEQESKMSPCVWEGVPQDCVTIDSSGKQTLTDKGKNFKNGFGLTQWTPATKLFTWCNNGGTSGNANGTGKVLPFYSIDTQLMRIEAEVKQCGKSWVEGLSQWISKPEKGYNMSFQDFTTSTLSAYDLAGAFAYCYERPARSTGTAAEQAALKKERGENAEYWFSKLGGISNSVLVTDKQLRVNSFRVDELSPTSAQISFINSNGIDYVCELYKSKTKVKTKKNDFEAEEKVKIINFTGLLPNTSYKVKLEVNGENDMKFEEELSFKTLQAYPSSVQAIKLIPNLVNGFKDHKHTMKFTLTGPSDVGYWKSNSKGLELQLYINGVSKKTITIDSVSNISWTALDLESKFGYTCKAGDSVQIGARVWVYDDNGNKLYDSSYPKMTKTFCLLNKPVLSFLNLRT